MRYDKIIEIAKNIHSDDYEVSEKLLAIQEVISDEFSIQNVLKADLIEMLRYLIEEYI